MDLRAYASSAATGMHHSVDHVQTLNKNKTLKNEKSAQRRKHCTLAVVKAEPSFRPAADPLPGGAGRPKFNQLEMVTNISYKPTLVKIDARNFELSR